MKELRERGYSQKLKTEIVDAVIAGDTVHKVACHFKVSTASVYIWLKEFGAASPQQHLYVHKNTTTAKQYNPLYPEPYRNKVINYSIVYTTRAAAKKFGVNKRTITAWRKLAGISVPQNRDVITKNIPTDLDIAIGTDTSQDEDVLVKLAKNYVKELEHYKTKAELLQSLLDLEQNK